MEEGRFTKSITAGEEITEVCGGAGKFYVGTYGGTVHSIDI